MDTKNGEPTIFNTGFEAEPEMTLNVTDINDATGSTNDGSGDGRNITYATGFAVYSAHKPMTPVVNHGTNGAKMYPNRIFVGGMSRETTLDDLRRFFSGYGNVKNVKIITDMEGNSKGYGFVTFESEEEAKRVQSLANNSVLHERILHVGPAIKRNLANTTGAIANGSAVVNGGPTVPGNSFVQLPSVAAGSARPASASSDQLLRMYSTLMPPNMDQHLLYQPTMLPYYNFPLGLPFLYPPTGQSNQQTSNQQF